MANGFVIRFQFKARLTSKDWSHNSVNVSNTVECTLRNG